ncbi:MAG: hypothetical protein WDM96_18625 [Lacunisphaera sp.]
MIAEFLVFARTTSRFHAPVYPRWTDQAQHLTEAYTAGQAAQADGLWAGVKAAWHKHAPQGALHDLAPYRCSGWPEARRAAPRSVSTCSPFSRGSWRCWR